jgi:hypothetical protein
MDLADLPGQVVEDVGVDPIAFLAGQGFARQLEKDLLVGLCAFNKASSR